MCRDAEKSKIQHRWLLKVERGGPMTAPTQLLFRVDMEALDTAVDGSGDASWGDVASGRASEIQACTLSGMVLTAWSQLRSSGHQEQTWTAS